LVKLADMADVERDGYTRSAASKSYLATVRDGALAADPQRVAARIVELVADQERWRARCLNLSAAESTISPAARHLLDSALATRVAEGLPGDRVFPVGPQNAHVDEIEATLIALACRLFKSEFVEWRAISTTMANGIVLDAFARPGDAILAQSMDGGANMSYQAGGAPTLRKLQVQDLPVANDLFEVDVSGLRELVARVRPVLIVVGGSSVLFPYPIEAIRDAADTVGALVLYDAAHVALLIAAGAFQDPLREGAHLMSMSTHKIMGGPVGGLICTNDQALAERLWAVPFPGLLQTRDQNKLAATAYALAEMTAFGQAYAHQVVANARALAEALADSGLPVLGAHRGYTMSHQVFINAVAIGARRFEALCTRCGILLNAARRVGDMKRGERSGIRLSVQEVTRHGMQPADMRHIALLIRRAVIGREPAERIADDVESFLEAFQTVQFTFR
jgi:glycine hydroxymethyltransferase